MSPLKKRTTVSSNVRCPRVPAHAGELVKKVSFMSDNDNK